MQRLLVMSLLPLAAAAVRIQDLEQRGSSRQISAAVAYFALGSFWTGEASFGCLQGVIRTCVGYTGGSKVNPEYRNTGDHAESVEVEYDPSVVRYEQLLDAFWASHDPTQVFGQGPDVGEQYRSVIFTQGDEEAKLAAISKEREQRKRPDATIVTDIEPFQVFYPAETEHQKFELRRRPLLLQLFGELLEDDFVRSTVASKFNGYAAGKCSPPLEKELDKRIGHFLREREKLVTFF